MNAKKGEALVMKGCESMGVLSSVGKKLVWSSEQKDLFEIRVGKQSRHVSIVT
jgi:hypothetical protein